MDNITGKIMAVGYIALNALGLGCAHTNQVQVEQHFCPDTQCREIVEILKDYGSGQSLTKYKQSLQNPAERSDFEEKVAFAFEKSTRELYFEKLQQIKSIASDAHNSLNFNDEEVSLLQKATEMQVEFNKEIQGYTGFLDNAKENCSLPVSYVRDVLYSTGDFLRSAKELEDFIFADTIGDVTKWYVVELYSVFDRQEEETPLKRIQSSIESSEQMDELIKAMARDVEERLEKVEESRIDFPQKVYDLGQSFERTREMLQFSKQEVEQWCEARPIER
jgi:hypothetical protein